MSSLYAHFIPSVAQKYWKLFLGNPRQVGPYLGDRVPRNSSSTYSLDRPTTSTFGTPATSRRTTLGSGGVSPVHHYSRIAKEATRRD